jgi:hypothetical protein
MIDGRGRISALNGGVVSEKPLGWAGVFHYRGAVGWRPGQNGRAVSLKIALGEIGSKRLCGRAECEFKECAGDVAYPFPMEILR